MRIGINSPRGECVTDLNKKGLVLAFAAAKPALAAMAVRHHPLAQQHKRGRPSFLLRCSMTEVAPPQAHGSELSACDMLASINVDVTRASVQQSENGELACCLQRFDVYG